MHESDERANFRFRAIDKHPGHCTPSSSFRCHFPTTKPIDMGSLLLLLLFHTHQRRSKHQIPHGLLSLSLQRYMRKRKRRRGTPTERPSDVDSASKHPRRKRKEADGGGGELSILPPFIHSTHSATGGGGGGARIAHVPSLSPVVLRVVLYNTIVVCLLSPHFPTYRPSPSLFPLLCLWCAGGGGGSIGLLGSLFSLGSCLLCSTRRRREGNGGMLRGKGTE